MKIKEFISELKKLNVEDCDIYYTFELFFEIDKTYVTLHQDEELDEYFCLDFLNQLENGYPIQYIFKKVKFHDIEVYLNEDVLIPRQETEELVNKVCNENKERKEEQLNILDMCSGSGCIGS